MLLCGYAHITIALYAPITIALYVPPLVSPPLTVPVYPCPIPAYLSIQQLRGAWTGSHTKGSGVDMPYLDRNWTGIGQRRSRGVARPYLDRDEAGGWVAGSMDRRGHPFRTSGWARRGHGVSTGWTRCGHRGGAQCGHKVGTVWTQGGYRGGTAARPPSDRVSRNFSQILPRPPRMTYKGPLSL